MAPKDKTFTALKAKWYKKLAQEGFEDIEQDEDHLKVWASMFFKVHYNPVKQQAKEDYYRLASQFFHSHNFETQLEAAIWHMHSEGHGVRTIALELKKKLKRKNVAIYKRKVSEIISKLSKQMLGKSTK